MIYVSIDTYILTKHRYYNTINSNDWSYAMSEYYNLNYSEQEIDAILRKIKECINENNFTISQNKNRVENIRFIREYNIITSKQKKILLSIVTKEFCHSLQNTNIGFEHETLYVFCPRRSLFDAFGEEELVDIYIKFIR